MLNQKTGKKDLVRAAVTLAAGLCILAFFIIAFGGVRFWEKLDNYVILFTSVKNLDEGRPVKYAGIDVGRVLSIQVDPVNPGLVRVVVGIAKDFVVHEGTTAAISQKGLVGDNYVLLSLTGAVGPAIPPGGEIPRDTTPDIMEVVGSVATLVVELKPKLTQIADSLTQLLNSDNRARMEELLAQLSELARAAHGALGTLDNDLRNVAHGAERGITETRAMVRDIHTGLNATVANLNAAISGVHGDAAATLALLREQTRTVGDSLASVSGQMEQDWAFDQRRVEDILENAVQVTENLRVLTESLKERPWQILYPPDNAMKE